MAILIKKYLKGLCILSIAVGCYFLAENNTDGFRTSKVLKDVNFIPVAQIDQKILSEDLCEAEKILTQNFIYLNKGRQFFVFESVDGNYVLKILNKNSCSYPSFLKKLTFFSPIKKILERKDKRNLNTFKRMKLSYEKLKSETNVIYTNLNSEMKLNKDLTVFNKYDHCFKLNSDDIFFVLQKKAKPFFSVLENFKEEQKVKEAINLYLALIVSRCLKHIADDDVDLRKNIGFYKDLPMIMDIGRLYEDERLQDKYCLTEEMHRSTKKLRKWLSKNHPELVSFLEDKIDRWIDRYCE